MAAEQYVFVNLVQRWTAKTFSVVKTLVRWRQNASNGTLTHILCLWRPTAVQNQNAKMVRILTMSRECGFNVLISFHQTAHAPLLVFVSTITNAFHRSCCHVESDVYATMATLDAKICVLKWAKNRLLDCLVRPHWPLEDTCLEINVAFTGNVVMSFKRKYVSLLVFSDRL